MLLMAGAIVLFVMLYQKRVLTEKLRVQKLEHNFDEKLIRTTIESQENERKRFAKDLHDELGLMLQALNLTIARTANEADRKQIQEMVNEFTETVRRISWDLMPTSLEKFGLMEAIDELCSRLTERSQIIVLFEKPDATPLLDKNQEILLYRIVQEAINNALKHSKASEIKVQIKSEHDLIVSIIDNGIGFDLSALEQRAPSQFGLGIFNMESRTRLLAGTIKFEKNNPTGTQVIIQVPLHGSN
jgi:signal transduction histidine kinase